MHGETLVMISCCSQCFLFAVEMKSGVSGMLPQEEICLHDEDDNMPMVDAGEDVLPLTLGSFSASLSWSTICLVGFPILFSPLLFVSEEGTKVALASTKTPPSKPT